MPRQTATEDASIDRRWQLARDTYKSGDNAGAIFLLLALEKDGIEQAAVEIGNIYEFGGGGIEKDIEKAHYWYNRAISKFSDSIAYLYQARLYYSNKEYSKALDNLHKITYLNQPGVFYMLGQMHQRGYGVEQNKEKALEYYAKAESKGHVIAGFCAGLILISRFSLLKGIKKCLGALNLTLRYSQDKTEHWRLTVGWRQHSEDAL